MSFIRNLKKKCRKSEKERSDKLKPQLEQLKARDVEPNILQRNNNAFAPYPMGNAREAKHERVARSDAAVKKAPEPYDDTEAGTVVYALPSGLFSDHNGANAALDLDDRLPQPPASTSLSSSDDEFRHVETVAPRANVPIALNDADEPQSRPCVLSINGNALSLLGLQTAPPLTTLENVVMTMKVGEAEDGGKGRENSKLGDDLRVLVAEHNDGVGRRGSESKIINSPSQLRDSGEKTAGDEEVETLGPDWKSETNSIRSSSRTMADEEKRKGEELGTHSQSDKSQLTSSRLENEDIMKKEAHSEDKGMGQPEIHLSGLRGDQYSSTEDRCRDLASASERLGIESKAVGRWWEIDTRFLTETADKANMNREEERGEENVRGDTALSLGDGSVEHARLGVQIESDPMVTGERMSPVDNEDRSMSLTDRAKENEETEEEKHREEKRQSGLEKYLRDEDDVGSLSLGLLTGYGIKLEEELEQGDDRDFGEREGELCIFPNLLVGESIVLMIFLVLLYSTKPFQTFPSTQHEHSHDAQLLSATSPPPIHRSATHT